MAREHSIERIARNLQNYKYCRMCGRINWHANRQCHGCGNRNFNKMVDECGRTLLLHWEKEPDLLLEL